MKLDEIASRQVAQRTELTSLRAERARLRAELSLAQTDAVLALLRADVAQLREQLDGVNVTPSRIGPAPEYVPYRRPGAVKVTPAPANGPAPDEPPWA